MSSVDASEGATPNRPLSPSAIPTSSRRTSVYSSLKSRRSHRARIRMESEWNQHKAADRIAANQAIEQTEINAFIKQLIPTLSLSLDLSSSFVDSAIRTPEVASILYEFITHTRASWNVNYRDRNDAHNNMRFASTTDSMSVGAATGFSSFSSRRLSSISTSSLSSPASSPRMAESDEITKLRDDAAPAEKTTHGSMQVATPAELAQTWPIPTRIIFFSAPTTARSEAKANAVEEEKQTPSPPPSHASLTPSPPLGVVGAAVAAPSPLSPSNRHLSSLLRDHAIRDPGLLVGIDGGELNLYTGSDMSIIGENVCVCITRKPDDSTATAAADSDNETGIDSPVRPSTDWNSFTCTIGPVGSLFPPALANQPLGSSVNPHTQLLQSLIDITQLLAPSVREVTLTRDTTIDTAAVNSPALLSPHSLAVGGGSATAAAKALRSTTAAAAHPTAARTQTDEPSAVSNTINSFLATFSDSSANLSALVHLVGPSSDFAFSGLHHSDQDWYSLCANRARIIEFETTIVRWCRQIETVFQTCAAEAANSMRHAAQPSYSTEPHLIGPEAELRLWNARLMRFDHLVNEFRHPHVAMVVSLLDVYRSRHLSLWLSLTAKAELMRQEAQDNVKYLTVFLRGVESTLYHATPSVCESELPSMMSLVSDLTSLAQFYHSTEHLTSLFLHMTGQIVKRAIQFLHAHTLWSRPRTQVWLELQSALSLLASSRSAYESHRSKLLASTSLIGDLNRPPFEVSEREVFRSVEQLATRITQVREIIEMNMIIEQIRALGGAEDNPNKAIEGINEISKQYALIERDICGSAPSSGPSSHSSSLSVTSPSFSLFDCSPGASALFHHQYQRFQSATTQIDHAFEKLFRHAFDKIDEYGQPKSDWTMRALEKVRRFQAIFANLRLADGTVIAPRPAIIAALRSHHAGILSSYSADLMSIKFLFSSLKKSPPLPIDTPPVVGAIQWARHLLRKVQLPMRVINQLHINEAEEANHNDTSNTNTPIPNTPVPNATHAPTSNTAHTRSATPASQLRARLNGATPDAATSLGVASPSASPPSPSSPAMPRPASSHGAVSTKLLRLYNSLVSSLTQFEFQLHREWLESLSAPNSPLRLSILFQRGFESELATYLSGLDSGDSRVFCSAGAPVTPTPTLPSIGSGLPGIGVNFAQAILQTAREAKHFMRIGMHVPHELRHILDEEEAIHRHHAAVQHFVREYTSILTKKISPIYLPLLKPRLDRFWRAFIYPALTSLTWSSLRLSDSLDEMMRELSALEDRLDEWNGLLTSKVIDGGLNKLHGTNIIAIPQTIVTIAEFHDRLTQQTRAILPTLNGLSHQIEYGLYALIESVCAGYTRDEVRSIRVACDSLVSRVHGFQFHAVGHLIESSLRKLKDKFSTNRNANNNAMTEASTSLEPVFSVSLSLTGSVGSHRAISMIPTLDEIQSCMNSTAKCILACSNGVIMPGQMRVGRSPDAGPLATYYDSIGKNRMIVKIVFQLTGTFLGLASKVQTYLRTISSDCAFLWRESLSHAVSEFLSLAPDLEQFESELTRLDQVGRQIRSIPDRHTIESLSFSTEQLKVEILTELSHWQREYGAHLLRAAQLECASVKSFLDAQLHSLSHPISSLALLLETVRLVRSLESDLDAIERRIQPVNDAHQLLTRFQLTLAQSDIAALDHVHSLWRQLKERLRRSAGDILAVHQSFRDEFIRRNKSFQAALHDFELRYDTVGPFLPDVPPEVASSRLDAFQDEYHQHASMMTFYEQLEILFFGDARAGQLTACAFMPRVARELQLGQQLFGLWKDLMRFHLRVRHRPWTDLIEVKTKHQPTPDAPSELLSGTGGLDALTAGIESIDKEMTTFTQRSVMLPRGIKDWLAYTEVKRLLTGWAETVPLLQRLTSESMQPRHWSALFELLRPDGSSDDPIIPSLSSLTLGHLLAPAFLLNRDSIDELIFHAGKEYEVELKFSHVRRAWSDEVIRFDEANATTVKNAVSARKLHGVLLEPKHSSYLVSKCSETRLILNSLLNSRYNSFCKDSLLSWVSRLMSVDDVLDEWIAVQQIFVYIHTVFSSGDVVRQLPHEADKFNAIEATWIEAITRIATQPNVIQICCDTSETSLAVLLPKLSVELDRCQKLLSSYLESKRLLFPRMYFLSDQVLLDILGGASGHLDRVQAYMYAMFDNIHQVELVRDEASDAIAMNRITDLMRSQPPHDESLLQVLKRPNWLITGMISSEGEKVKLRSPVSCQGNIELWLRVLEHESHETIRAISSIAINSVDAMQTNEFVDTYPAQLVLLAYQLSWTRSAEDGIRTSKRDRNSMLNQLKRMVDLLKTFVSLTNHSTLHERTRQTVETLITIQVHQRDVYERLTKAKVKSIQDFEWLKQTRFYWIWEKNHCQISITDVDFVYANEYMGCAGRLVITPLTVRVYVTLAQSLGLGLGGSPVGPAGTGKTETVKDLGRTLGKFVLISNCSDQLDYLQLGKIFKGVAISGVWACFDEFNRIKLEVLSVVAQQIATILTAIREYKTKMIFTDGAEINVDPTCGGRVELPENLKSLFRSVSMMVPERSIIIQVRLAASGFHRNQSLAKKFTLLYHLCEQQLSPQRHYDFGLRNILSVLRVAGPAKRLDRGQRSEEEIFTAVVRDMNLSKLVDSDEILFRAMIEDVFPMANNTQSHKSEEQVKFDECIHMFCAQSNLIPHPNWTRKVVELNQLLSVRHGVMVVGGSSSGKSIAIECLRFALESLDCPRPVRRMNPKSLTVSQMFGRLDEATHDWSEGILSALWRQATNEANNANKAGQVVKPWIILDGPIDTLWIENLNSVLDDSRVLTLANGDRLSMPKDLRLIFEVDSLTDASPATVSRAGMIYMSNSTLTWATILDGWRSARTNTHTTHAPHNAHNQRNNTHAHTNTTLPHRPPSIEYHPHPTRPLRAHEFTARCTALCLSDADLICSLLHRVLPPLFTWLRDSGIASVIRIDDNNRISTLLNYLDGLLALRVPMTTDEIEEEKRIQEKVDEEQKTRYQNKQKSIPTDPQQPTKVSKRPPTIAPTPPTAAAATAAAHRTPAGLAQRRDATLATDSNSTTGDAKSTLPSSSPARLARHAALERIVLFALSWSIGGLLSPLDRIRFSDYLRSELHLRVPYSHLSPMGRSVVSDAPTRKDMAIVAGETIFDFFLSPLTFRWRSWAALLTLPTYNDKLNRFRIARYKLDESGDGVNDPHAPLRAIKQVESELAEEAELDQIGDSTGETPIDQLYGREEDESDIAHPSVAHSTIDFESVALLSRWCRSPALSPLVSSRLLVPPFESLFIPTRDSVRAEYTMMLVAKQRSKSMLLVGESGSKTVTAHRFLDSLCRAHSRVSSTLVGVGQSIRPTAKTINFSSATTTEALQNTIESCVVKRFGNVYGPPQPDMEAELNANSPGGVTQSILQSQQQNANSKRASMKRASLVKESLSHAHGGGGSASSIQSHLTLFIDDLNMPTAPLFGPITNELVRQVMEHREMYSLVRPGEKMLLRDVNILAAMNLPHGGRNDIPNRLKGKFHILHLTPPSKEAIDAIFNAIVRAYFNSEHGFVSADLLSLARALPQLTRILWSNTARQLLPTPTKSHYLFTIRDLSRIFEGICCNANPAIIRSEVMLINLWSTECQRVMRDKLSSHTDIDWFDREMRRCMEQILPAYITNSHDFQSQLFHSLTRDVASAAPAYFIHFLHSLDDIESTSPTAIDAAPASSGQIAPRSMADLAKEQEETAKYAISASKNAILRIASYEPAPQNDQLRELLDAYLAKYNGQSRITPMQLVFFPDAIAHLLRIARILAIPNKGHALLVGIGGSGKQSLTRIANFIVGNKLVTPSVTTSLADFIDLLKGLYLDCGVRGVKSTLLVTDADLAKDEAGYLELINTLLTSGDMARLFSRDESTTILYEVRLAIEREAELTARQIALWEVSRREQATTEQQTTHAHTHADTDALSQPVDYHKEFLSRVRSNLHVVLCFSPLHPNFRLRSLHFPGLISGCTIDWFPVWSSDALIAVSSKFLADLRVPIIKPNAQPTDKPDYQIISEQMRRALAHYMARVHAIAEEHAADYYAALKRRVYQTPKSFISFVGSFKSLYASQLHDLQLQHARLTGGLAKLIQAEKDISTLEAVLSEREKDLALASSQLEVMMSEINANKKVAQKKSAEMAAVHTDMVETAALIDRDRQDAEADLAAATPLMIAAQRALETLSQKDINLLKALRTPHNLIERVFDAILILNRRPIRPIEMDARFGQASSIKNGGSTSAAISSSSKDFPRPATSWSSSVTMLRSSGFLDLLAHFPKHALDDETIELLEPYLRQVDFNPESATQVSSWVAGLTTWVSAIKKYWEIYKFVQPKKIHLDQQRERMELAEVKLAAAEKELTQKQLELDLITARYEESAKRKESLESDMNVTRLKISSARALLHGLSAEQSRWSIESRSHQRVLGQLLGNSLIAQSFLSYAGGFNQPFRIKITHAWTKQLESTSKELIRSHHTPDTNRRASATATAAMAADGIPFSSQLNLCTFLVAENAINGWTSLHALPVDRHSIENGVLLTVSDKYPLLIDPQGQGIAWLKRKWGGATAAAAAAPPAGSNHVTPSELVICSACDVDLRPKLESALEYGKIFLLTDIGDRVPALLTNVVDKVFMRRGHLTTVSLHGVDVDVHSAFFLTLTTKLANPHFSPEISAAARIIDFTVTQSSLEAQLLERVIILDKPELEQTRVELSHKIQSYRASRLELEDDLLFRLSTAQGDLLADQQLIDLLNRTKRMSEEMSDRLSTAQEMERKINDAREEYRQIAIRGSILFFITADMARVNHMYQTSLDQFLSMFDTGFALVADQPNPPFGLRRVTAIVDAITWSVYTRVIAGLFRQDTAMFQLLIAIKVDMQRGSVKQYEFELFIRGAQHAHQEATPIRSDTLTDTGSTTDIGRTDTPDTTVTATDANPFAAWLPNQMWSGVLTLLELPYFRSHLVASLDRHSTYWSDWLHSDSPEVNRLPDAAMEEKLDAFARLCIIRCLRPDRTILAAMKYIQSSLGDAFLSPPPLQLDDVIRMCSPSTPIVFFLSTGSDPSQSIKDAAHRWQRELHTISMGQGQEVRARAIINKITAPQSNGGWMLIQNAHLSTEFVIELNDILAALPTDGSNSDFRLWLTTDPSPSFPIVFLHRSVKLTSDPPAGIRHGLARQYASISQQLLEAVDRPEWQPLLFAICFMHCAVIERRKFGPIGWQHKYEFNSSDLHASIEWCKKYLYTEEQRKPLRFETIRYMICDIIYGGRIIDDWDRLLLSALGEQWLTRDIAHTDKPDKFDFAPGYPLPRGLTKVSDYLSFIGRLPMVDPPQLLGLGANADLIYRHAEAAYVCRTILAIQPKDTQHTVRHNKTDESANGNGISASRDQQVARRIDAILAEWPHEFDTLRVEQQIGRLEANLHKQSYGIAIPSHGTPGSTGVPVSVPLSSPSASVGVVDLSGSSPVSCVDSLDGDVDRDQPPHPPLRHGHSPTLTQPHSIEVNHQPVTNPMHVYLRQEVDRMQAVLRTVRANLVDLQSTLAGSIMMTADAESIFDAIAIEQLPAAWEQLTWHNPAATLTSWLTSMHGVYSQLSSWLRHGAPRVFLLGSFFHPRGFLTAVKQSAARASRQFTIDDIEIHAQITTFERREAVKNRPDEGVYIAGMYLEGASWDPKRLRLVDSSGSGLGVAGRLIPTPLPVVHVSARGALSSASAFGHTCPVYRISARTEANFIMTMPIASDIRTAHWTRRGVAIICEHVV